jgi:hypothetical protein
MKMLNRLVKFRRGQGDSYEDLKGADVSPTRESGDVEINPEFSNVQQQAQSVDGKGVKEGE